MQRTACSASAAEYTRGTMTPSAPASSARAKRGRSFASTRTSAVQRRPIAWSVGTSSPSVPAPCSRSTSNQSNPERAQISAASGDPRLRNVPTSVSPASRRALVVEALDLRPLTLVLTAGPLRLGLVRHLGRSDVPPDVGSGEIAVRLGLADDHARARLPARRLERPAQRAGRVDPPRARAQPLRRLREVEPEVVAVEAAVASCAELVAEALAVPPELEPLDRLVA